MLKEDCFSCKELKGGKHNCTLIIDHKTCVDCKFYKTKDQFIKEYEESYKKHPSIVKKSTMAKNLYKELGGTIYIKKES